MTSRMGTHDRMSRCNQAIFEQPAFPRFNHPNSELTDLRARPPRVEAWQDGGIRPLPAWPSQARSRRMTPVCGRSVHIISHHTEHSNDEMTFSQSLHPLLPPRCAPPPRAPEAPPLPPRCALPPLPYPAPPRPGVLPLDMAPPLRAAPALLSTSEKLDSSSAWK